ncbi:chemotaxis protein CheW [soil metagenome]
MIADPAPDGVAEQQPLTEDMESVELLAVLVSGVEFGIPVDAVCSVITVPAITRLPFPPPSVAGVASVRGTLVPVLDLGERLLRSASSRTGRLVLVEDFTTGQQIGLLVDAVLGLVAGHLRSLTPPPEVEASLPFGWIEGIVSPEPDRLITLLNLEPVLAVSTPTDKEQQ